MRMRKICSPTIWVHLKSAYLKLSYRVCLIQVRMGSVIMGLRKINLPTMLTLTQHTPTMLTVTQHTWGKFMYTNYWKRFSTEFSFLSLFDSHLIMYFWVSYGVVPFYTFVFLRNLMAVQSDASCLSFHTAWQGGTTAVCSFLLVSPWNGGRRVPFRGCNIKAATNNKGLPAHRPEHSEEIQVVAKRGWCGGVHHILFFYGIQTDHE